MATNINDQGRIDWMPRRKVWKVVGYCLWRDITIGYATDYQAAVIILQDWISEGRKALGVGA